MLISGAYGIAQQGGRGMLWEESSSVLIIISLSSCTILTARECLDKKIEAFRTDASGIEKPYDFAVSSYWLIKTQKLKEKYTIR